MPKVEIILILLFILFGSILGRPRKDEKSRNKETKSTSQTIATQEYIFNNNCSKSAIDVRLRHLTPKYIGPRKIISSSESQKQTGVIEITAPHSSESFFLCFPEDEQNQRQVSIFAHVLCRQMGFMTFAAVHGKELPSTLNDKRSLMTKSYSCSGRERDVSQCTWHNFTISRCQIVSEISCGECNNVFNDVSGIIRSPGYPMMYLFDTTCEYQVVVPERHFIHLSLYTQNSLFSKISLPCSSNKPYVEISYGFMGAMSIFRYCDPEIMKNISIPFNEVKIRIFTGFYSPDHVTDNKEKGFMITFEAISVEKSSNWPWKLIYICLFLLTFSFIMLACHYCHKSFICNFPFPKKNVGLPTHKAQTMEEADKTYVFEKCKIKGKENKGLRLRSNGSGDKVSRIFFPSGGSKTYEIPKTLNKNLPQVETPKTIPEVVVNGEHKGEIFDPIYRVKANLLDRYSRNSRSISHSNGSTSEVISTSTPVFYPPAPNFDIYISKSSELNDDVKIKVPYETAL